MVTKHDPSIPSNREMFEARCCTSLSYRITTTSDKFALEDFQKAIGGSSDESRGWNAIVRHARNPKAVGYHLHAYWRRRPENESQMQLQVDYHAFTPESDEKHSEPYAEEFVHWVGKFFKDESLMAHIHAEFEFPINAWQTKIMALPIRIPYAEKEAVIDGLSINLPSKPEGVHDVWVQRGRTTLDIQLYADRPLVFRNFTPQNDLGAFDVVVRTLIEEKSQ